MWGWASSGEQVSPTSAHPQAFLSIPCCTIPEGTPRSLLGWGLGQPRGSAGALVVREHVGMCTRTRTHTHTPAVLMASLPPQMSASMRSEHAVSMAGSLLMGARVQLGRGPRPPLAPNPAPLLVLTPLPPLGASCLSPPPSPSCRPLPLGAAQMPPPAWTPVRKPGDPTHSTAPPRGLLPSLPCGWNPSFPAK